MVFPDFSYAVAEPQNANLSFGLVSVNTGHPIFEVYGEPLNPPTHTLYTNEKHPKKLILTRIDRAQNLWEDNYNFLWTKNENESWIKLTSDEYQVPDYNPGPKNGLDRSSQHFNTYMMSQILYAFHLWNPSEIHTELKNSHTIDFSPKPRIENSVLQNDILKQQERAQRTLDESYVPIDILDKPIFVKDYSEIKGTWSDIAHEIEKQNLKIIKEKFSDQFYDPTLD